MTCLNNTKVDKIISVLSFEADNSSLCSNAFKINDSSPPKIIYAKFFVSIFFLSIFVSM